MKRNHFTIISVLLILGLILAPLAYQLFHMILLVPTVNYLWGIKQVIRILPQSLYWILIVASLGMIVVILQIKNLVMGRSKSKVAPDTKSPIKYLSENITLSEKSNYFKWVVANHLANLSLEIKYREKENNKNGPQDDSRMELPPPSFIKKYFNAGLQNSFMDYRKKRKLFGKSDDTPFDIQLEDVIRYLESQMESE